MTGVEKIEDTEGKESERRERTRDEQESNRESTILVD